MLPYIVLLTVGQDLLSQFAHISLCSFRCCLACWTAHTPRTWRLPTILSRKWSKRWSLLHFSHLLLYGTFVLHINHRTTVKSEENRRRLSELCTRDKNINLMSKWVDRPPRGWGGGGVVLVSKWLSRFSLCVCVWPDLRHGEKNYDFTSQTLHFYGSLDHKSDQSQPVQVSSY